VRQEDPAGRKNPVRQEDRAGMRKPAGMGRPA